MKLWLKQTMLAMTIMLLTVSTCLYSFTAFQARKLLDQAEENGRQYLHAFCEHISTLDQTGRINESDNQTTRTALVQYTFAAYAHLLQGPDRTYSLADTKGYLYNISPADPLTVLPMTEQDISGQCTIVAADVPYLIQGICLNVLQTHVVIYLTQNLTETYADIARLTRSAQVTLGVCLFLSSILLAFVFQKSMQPLQRLTQITQKVAAGHYDLRSNIAAKDEVGELSASFDAMAETVEQKILSLEDTARRQKLLLGALTHEMKTPMTAIIGYAQSILTMPLTEDGRMDAANEIYEAAQRMERLSQKLMQLITLTEHPSVMRQTIVLTELFTQVRQSVQKTLAEKNINLTIHARAFEIVGDRDLLFALLTNLILNAANASAPGAAIMLCAEKNEKQVRLSVRDHGSGIPADKVALVTEPFYRVDKARSRRQGGAGLGLAICQLIAQAHNSKLVIKSVLGQGTTVSIDLPCREEIQDE